MQPIISLSSLILSGLRASAFDSGYPWLFSSQWIDKKPHRRYSNIAQGRSRSWNIRSMLCFFATVWIVDEDNAVRHHKIECKYPGIYWINNPEEPMLLTLVPTKSSRLNHPSTDLPNFHIDAWQHQKIHRFVRHRLDIASTSTTFSAELMCAHMLVGENSENYAKPNFMGSR